jgi:hypothetical protein
MDAYHFARVRFSDETPCACVHPTLGAAFACEWGGNEAVVVAFHGFRPEPVGWADLQAALGTAAPSPLHARAFRDTCARMTERQRVMVFGAVPAATIDETLHSEACAHA